MCVELLADSQLLGHLMGITKEVLSSFETCASDFAAGMPDYQIVINDPNNATCTGQNSKRTFAAGEDFSLARSMLRSIEYSPSLGPMKSSGLSLTRKQLSNCAQTGSCFETCTDCRLKETVCGTQALIISTAVCGVVATYIKNVVAVEAGTACAAACAALGPLVSAGCAVFCGKWAGDVAAVAVIGLCAEARTLICDPIAQRCANCNSAHNGICNPGSTQCCAGETGTQCGVGCCCCPFCQAPGGINCECTAAPC